MIVITGLGQMIAPDGMSTSGGSVPPPAPPTNRTSKIYATAAATRYGGGIDYPDPYVQGDTPPRPIVEPIMQPPSSTPPIPQPPVPVPQPDLPPAPQPDPTPPSAGAQVVIDSRDATRTCPDGSVVHIAATCPIVPVPAKIIGFSPRGKKIAIGLGVLIIGGLILRAATRSHERTR